MARKRSSILYDEMFMEFDKDKFRLKFKSYSEKNDIPKDDIFKQIAEELDLHLTTVKKWYYGESSPNDIKEAIKVISRILGINEKELLKPVPIDPIESAEVVDAQPSELIGAIDKGLLLPVPILAIEKVEKINDTPAKLSYIRWTSQMLLMLSVLTVAFVVMVYGAAHLSYFGHRDISLTNPWVIFTAVMLYGSAYVVCDYGWKNWPSRRYCKN